MSGLGCGPRGADSDGDSQRCEFVDNPTAESLDDIRLVLRLKQLAADERASLVIILSHMAEFDRRKLYSPLGYPSMFAYCTTVLKFAEDTAYRRIRAARVCQDHPEVFSMIAEGRLQMSAIALLAPYLEAENALALLDRACGKSYRDVQRITAELEPRPDKPDVIRRLSAVSPDASAPAVPGIGPDGPVELSFAAPISSSEPATPASETAPAPGPEKPPGAGLYDRIDPTSPGRVRFSFTGDEALLRKLERAQAVLWHKHPAGKLEDIFAEALDFLLAKKDPELRLDRKKRLQRKPSPANADTGSRRIPQWVKDEVYARDGGRCAFTSPDGARCPEREGLEFDHVMPWALGGRSFDPRNIRLLCRGHNQDRARRMFGERR